MIFATKYDRQEDHLTYESCPGDEFENVYEYKIDEKTGKKDLVPVGKTNVREYIQSFKDSVDINKLMERFKNGEVNVLNKVEGFYADVSEFPSSYAELFARVEEAEKKFMELPPDVRSKFNNSASEFWAEFGNEGFLNKIKNEKPIDEVIVDDVKENVDNE